MDVVSAREAREYLLGQLGLRRFHAKRGAAGVRATLDSLRCVQLDPLDVIGTNADLVALARVEGVARGDVYRHVMPGHAFEHFAKERCILPARAFPYYRDQAAETPWWRLGERTQRVPAAIVEHVLDEVEARGPISAAELTDRGAVDPIDWSGWKGTARASSMALEILWTRCQIVVCGRSGRGKVYDVPRRALPDHADLPSGDFARWALLERVEAAGLLARAGGPCWSMLSDVRTSGLVERLIDEGAIEEVKVEGSSRSYLAPAGFRERRFGRFDDALRILGPLDPLLWDRKLVKQVFGLDYVWEVYKPAPERKWGYYVCPLLHRGELVGRIEARVHRGALVVERAWEERPGAVDRDALTLALERHAEALFVEEARMPRRWLRSPP